MDDFQIIDKARRGERDAFRTLVESHARPVFILAFRMTGNQIDAEDMVQETFLKAWKQVGRFDGRAGFGTWLHRICANCCIDLIRSRKRRETTAAEDDTLQKVATGAPSPERLALSSQVHAILGPALAALSDMERAAFILRHYEGMGIEEISLALGVHSGAAKHSVFRAVKKTAADVAASYERFTMTHLSEEELILLYYAEPDSPPGGRAHLRECMECSAAADSLAVSLNLCTDLEIPEFPAEYERSVWAQLAPHIQPTRRRWLRRPAWILLPLAAMLMIIAFLAGRASRTAAPPILAGLSSQARNRILEISLADHLDRVGMLLTEISNDSDSAASDFASERGRAQDLVDEGRLMRQALALRSDRATLTFVDDTERFMTEIAHAPDAQALQRRLGSESLLFKVRIMESNLRKQGQKS